MNNFNSTARIDFQKLQILNDRICQTLEALNQVRLSAMTHAGFNSYAPYAPSFTPGFQAGVQGTVNQGMIPTVGQWPQISPWMGLPHSVGLNINPYFSNGYAPMTYGFGSGLGSQSYGQYPQFGGQYSQFAQHPQFANPYGWNGPATIANIDLARTQSVGPHHVAPVVGW